MLAPRWIPWTSSAKRESPSSPLPPTAPGMGTRSVCFVTSSFNLILLDPFRFDYGPRVIAISLLVEGETVKEEG